MNDSNHLLWKLTDKTKFLEMIRKHFDFSSEIKDEEIYEFATQYLDTYLQKYYVVVGNEMELSKIRKGFPPRIEAYLYDRIPISAEADRFFSSTERLFREGFYIQACISARFTLEKLLQERVMELNPDELPEDQAEKIKRFQEMINSNERNPRIRNMVEQIKAIDNWSDDFTQKVETIINYGDWQIHHRFDKIFEGTKFEDFKWSIAKPVFELNGVKTEPDLELTFIENRERRAREHSFEALKYLYEIMSFYRVNPKRNDKNRF